MVIVEGKKTEETVEEESTGEEWMEDFIKYTLIFWIAKNAVQFCVLNNMKM